MMRDGARAVVTLVVLVVLLVVGSAWGWSRLTAPFPKKAEAPVCVDTVVGEGDRVYPGQVTVSVYNAGSREGLAGRTMRLFKDAGFVQGDSGNAPGRVRVRRAQIWTREPDNPAVRLVASRLGKRTQIVRRDPVGVGVTVVVGDEFRKLAEGSHAILVRGDAEICSPPVG